MKDVYDSLIAIRNRPLLTYSKSIVLPQFIHKTFVSLPLRCFKFKQGLAPALCEEMVPQNRQNSYNNADNTVIIIVKIMLIVLYIGEINSQRPRELELRGSDDLGNFAG